MPVDNWWDYPTNYSGGTEQVNTTFGLMEYSNYATGGWFGLMILFMTFVVTLSAGILSGVKRAFLASSFITTIFAIWLTSLGLVAPYWVAIFLVLTGVSAISAFNEKSGGL